MIIPHTTKIICHNTNGCAGRKYNLIDISRKIENLPNSTDEEILTLLRTQLNLNVTTQKDELDIEKQLEKYVEYKWALVPCAKNGKNPIQNAWQTKENRDKSEWFNWLNSGLNLGTRTGEVSNLCVIDLDFYTKQEKVELVKETTTKVRLEELSAKKVIPSSIKAILGDTLIQETLGGFHVFYQANDLPKGSVDIEGIHIDIETEGGQVIIPPSPQVAVEEEYKEGEIVKKRVVGYGHRKFINNNPIIPIPKELYNLLIGTKVKPTPKPLEQLAEEKIANQIKNEKFKFDDLTKNRHMTLLTFGGILQKTLNINTVENVLKITNNLLPEPLPNTEIINIVDNLSKYTDEHETQIRNSILDYLNETDIATKTEIEYAVFSKRTTAEEKKRLDRILANLIVTHKILKYNSRNYKIIRDMKGSDIITNIGNPINFKMPYFHDYAYFNFGDIVIIGGSTKTGKTSLSMNICKRIVSQGIKPDYFYNESGGRFSKHALKLGLKDGDFTHYFCPNPMEVIIKPRSVCIFDWVRPFDFARTADMYASIVEKLQNNNSIMIAFAQLRDDTENTWFAKDLIRQFVSLSAKYIYEDQYGINTKFILSDIRDRKNNGKKFEIPCKYFEETNEVKMQEEIDEEQKDINEKIAKEEFKNKTKDIIPESTKVINKPVNDNTEESFNKFEVN